MSAPFPDHARIVVIGGGAIGTSIAFHLARQGERDVVLLEKTRLTEGATWHAAGLVGQFRSRQNLMRIMNASVRLFEQLAAETGQETGWRKVGSVRLAASRDRLKELQRSHSAARAVGFEMHMLGPDEIRNIYPLINADGLVAGAFIPDDGHIDPNSLTQAFAKGFRQNGGRIFEGAMVTELVRSGSRITHVVTDQGAIEAETVINAAGLWARQVGWMAGVNIPAGVLRHQYMVTEKTDRIPDDLPALRDPDGGYYAKPEPGALAIGGWERTADVVNPADGFPWDCARHLFESNMERLEEILDPASRRLPVINDLGVRSVINGPIPVSPDGEPVIGPVPGLDNFFAACAFTSGIAASGGVGEVIANWIREGDPGMDLWAFDIRRFGPLHSGHRFLHERARESYTRYYAIHWPGEEPQSARGVRRSPLYDTLKSKGAVFGSKFGWERANWFARENIPPQDRGSFGRDHLFETVGFEHRAAREGVVLVDMTSFTKIEISGPDACAVLQWLCTADIDRPAGGAAYTQLCNDRGGIEADVTIIRRAEDRFWLITGSGFGVRDRHWIESSLSPDRDVSIRDITSAMGVINIQGPNARKVLGSVCDDDLGNDAFPFMTARDITVGHAPATAWRMTYVGELGWELYTPMEYMQHVYETLWDAGRAYSITDMGYRAIDSLRLEKRFLAWGADIGPDYTPLEAGLGFLIDWNKGDFRGRSALLEQRERGVRQKLVCLALDDPLPVFGGEAILLGGDPAGQTTSGNYGYTVGKSLVLGYVPNEPDAPEEDLSGTGFAVEAFGQISTATLVSGAACDPGREKITGQ